MRRLAVVSLSAVLLLLVGSAVSPPPVVGQVTAADSASILLEAADRFESDGQYDVARAIYELLRERYPTTSAGVEASRRLASILSEGTRGSGSVELQVWTTLYGLFLGVAIPGAMGADDSEPYGLGLLVGGPVGFFTGRAVAKANNLTEGQARAITMGGTWGTWQGFGWRDVFDLGEEEFCDTFSGQEFCYEGGDTSEETFFAMILGGAAGITAGAVLSRRAISPGAATAVNFGSLWGTWFGVAIGVLLGQERDALLATTLLGGNAGLVTTAVLAPGWNMSRSRARLISIAGVVGGIGGAGIDLLVQPESEKTAIGIPLATSLLGLALGAWSTRDYDRVTRPAGGDPQGRALLNFADGSWQADVPMPFPTMVEMRGPRGTVRKPALGFTLLRAVF